MKIKRTNEQESGKAPSKAEREFSTMVALMSALSFGLMLGIAQALRMDATGISFEVSLWTAVAFLAGFNGLFVYLELLFFSRDKSSPFLRRGVLVALILVTLAVLLYQLRTLRGTGLADTLIGSSIAVCFIAAGWTLLRRFMRAAEREEQAQEARERQAASDKKSEG